MRVYNQLPLSLRERAKGEGVKTPLIPIPSPSSGEGSEPSALRARSFTRGKLVEIYCKVGL
jgi:hypothetical protein